MFLSDQDDVIKPVSIEHGLDVMMNVDGHGFEFHYNFLDYAFQDGDTTLTARHYMDVPGEVSLTAHPMPPFTLPFVERALLYLALRYATITYPGDEGYVPLPQAIADQVAQAVRACFEHK